MKVILHLVTLFTVQPPPKNGGDQTVVSPYLFQLAFSSSTLQIPIRVNIRHVQTQLNTQVLQVAVEGHNHTMTTLVQVIANMYHDRIFDLFTEENFKAGRRNAFIHQRPPTNAINSRTASSYDRRDNTNIATVSNSRPPDVAKFSALESRIYADS
jgi:hypothetical protein